LLHHEDKTEGSRWNWSTNQCSNGEACCDAGNGSCADIARDAANGCEGAEGIGDVFGNLGIYVLDMLVSVEGRGTRGKVERHVDVSIRDSNDTSV
jgi:hypothetical protein